MTQEYISVLKEKKSAVARELEQLRVELADITERIQVKEAQLNNIQGLLTLEGAGEAREIQAASTRKPALRPEPLRSSSFVAAAAEILADEGKPMHYLKLTKALQERSVYVPGRNPAANLIAHLTRDSRFKRVARGTYALQNWQARKGR